MQKPLDKTEMAASDTGPEEHEPKVLSFPVVGIGASAGGLEAFTKLLEALPVDTGMAFVLIQHLGPLHKSQLAEILSRATEMEVAEVVDGTPVIANHIYIIPPNTVLQIANGSLHLTPRLQHPAPHLPIDEFFESLALEQGRLAFGVVLSGTGTDGCVGVKAIKNRCGITFAQEETSAAQSGMPRSAIATGAVDYVVAPAGIAQELARISRHPYVVPQAAGVPDVPTDSVDELPKLYSLLFRATGVDFSHYRQTTLRRRIGRRMLVHHSETVGQYVDYASQNPEELNELYQDLLINVTSFFRDPKAFLALGKQIEALIQAGRITSSFRAWVPGCSTGEEVYSLAICISGVFETAGIHPTIQLFGTDISESSLRAARAGQYGEGSLRDVSQQHRDRYFQKVDGAYQINKLIRANCVFARQDLTRDIPFSHLDLISCRNTLIYVEPVLQRALMPVFHYGLNPSGLLFLGSSETIGATTDLFATLDQKHKIFARRTGPSRLAQGAPIQRGANEPIARNEVKKSVGSHDVQKRLDRFIQKHYSPDCVLVNQSLQIVEVRGHVGPYLEPPSGPPTNDLIRMSKEGLRYALREVMDRALQNGAPIEKKGICMRNSDHELSVDIEATPLPGEPGAERFCLVVFRPSSPLPEEVPTAHAQPVPDDETDSALHLETELTDVREYVRTISEDYEAVLEELRASNEELQSANEELQSTNEELGTTKEELQSANEELTTVNEEMENRNQQLGELSDDVVNMMGAVNIPILRVDRKHALCRFTPAAEKSFGLQSFDILQPLHFLQARLGTTVNLDLLVKEVIESLVPQTHELQDVRGNWWSLSIRPYRTGDDRLDGAVLAFMDVNAIRQAFQASQEARRYADNIVEAVREPLVILNVDLRIDRANAAFYNKFCLKPEELEGLFFHDLSQYGWNSSEIRLLLEETSMSVGSSSELEVMHAYPHIGLRMMRLNARQLRIESQSRILLTFEDVTEQRQSEVAAAGKLKKKGQELDRSKEELRALAAHLITAHEEEQRRIAHELHDDLVQKLGFLEFQVEQLRVGPVSLQHADVQELLKNLQAQVSDLSEVTRNLSHGLHPAIIDDLGVVAAVRKLTKELDTGRKGSIRFVNRAGKCSIPRKQFGSTVYRIAQEALRNAGKHAPNADVVVALSCNDNELLLTVRDNGPGFNPATARGAGGLGIVNMQERAQLIGAVLTIQSKPGKGTSVILRVVLRKEPETESLSYSPIGQ
jgi:two-component system CheB/CheR fusion protein